MSDIETPVNEAIEAVPGDDEILDVTIIEDGLEEEPIAESAYDYPVAGTSCTPSPVTSRRSSAL